MLVRWAGMFASSCTEGLVGEWRWHREVRRARGVWCWMKSHNPEEVYMQVIRWFLSVFKNPICIASYPAPVHTKRTTQSDLSVRYDGLSCQQGYSVPIRLQHPEMKKIETFGRRIVHKTSPGDTTQTTKETVEFMLCHRFQPQPYPHPSSSCPSIPSSHPKGAST